LDSHQAAWNDGIVTYLGEAAQKDALSNIVHGYLQNDLITQMQIAKGVHKAIFDHVAELFPGTANSSGLSLLIGDAGTDSKKRYAICEQLIQSRHGELLSRVGGMLGFFELAQNGNDPISLDTSRTFSGGGLSVVLTRKNGPAWVERAGIYFFFTPAEAAVRMRISEFRIHPTNGQTVLVLHATTKDEISHLPDMILDPSNEESVALFTSGLQMHFETTVLDPQSRHLYSDSKVAQLFFNRVDAYNRANAPVVCNPACHCRLEPEASAGPVTTAAKPTEPTTSAATTTTAAAAPQPK
jgi:hypothetical protein